VKPLQFNMSKFKKISGDKNHTVMQHDDGHQITIAHKPLNALQRKQLMSMPLAEGGEVKGVHTSSMAVERPKDKKEKMYAGESEAGHTYGNRDIHGPASVRMARNEHYRVIGEMKAMPKPKLKGLAEGGEVDEDQPLPINPDAASAVSQSFKKAVHSYADGSADAGSDQLDSPPQMPHQPITINVGTQPTQPAPQSPASIYGDQQPQVQVPQVPNAQSNPGQMNSNQTVNLPATVQQEQALAPQQQSIDSAKGKALANVEQGYNKQRAAIAQQDQQHIQDLQQHTDEFANYIANNPIDPNHWADTRALGKTGAAMSLFLAGFAGGLGNNAPLEFINKQIDRDIDAQKARSDQAKTIYGAYERLYGNQNVATQLTKASMIDIYNHQMQQVAQKLATPQAALNAKMFQIKAAQDKAEAIRQASQDPDIETAYQHSQMMSGKAPQLSPKEQEAADIAKRNYSKQPDQSESQSSFQPILDPGANKKVEQAQIAKLPGWDDIGEVRQQLTAAQQLEKVLNGPKGDGVGSVHDYFKQMYTNSGEGGYIRGAGGALQRSGSKITNALSHLIPGSAGTNLEIPAYSSATKAYETNRQNLKTSLASALKGLVSVNDLDEMLDKYSPGYGDKPSDVKKKETDFINELKRSLPTSALERHNLLAKPK